MPRESDMVVRLVSSGRADQAISVVGDQVLTATSADEGKVVTVAADGTLALADPDWVTTTSHGALCDARSVADVATTSGSAVVTSAAAAFTAADVGKVASLRVGANGLTTTIASVQSATQATLAANAPATGAVGILTFGTDDTAAIQAAVDACPVAGTVYHPGQSIITAALSITKHLTIRGRGVAEATGGVIASSYGSGPSVVPYIAGSVFIQATAGADGIAITGTGVNVHLHDLGVRFAPAIMFLSTGHGIFAKPSGLYNTKPDNGVFNPRWDNIVVFGHDGNHYAYFIFNSNLGTFTHLRWHGGGGIWIEADTDGGAQYGNATFIHPYGRTLAGGTAHGFALQSHQRLPSGTGSLNLINFLRPQCNIVPPNLAPNFSALGIAVPSLSQYLWATLGTPKPSAIDVIDPNLESHVSGQSQPIDFGGMYSGTIVRKGFGLSGTIQNGGFSREDRSMPGLPVQPTWVMGTGAGTGATAQIIQGDDQSGVLLINMGTTPAAAGAPLITLTCPSMPAEGIKAVFVEGYAAGGIANKHFYGYGVAANSKSFEIRCSETLPGSPQQVQLMFQVVPKPAFLSAV